jgi:hypothetical protein
MKIGKQRCVDPYVPELISFEIALQACNADNITEARFLFCISSALEIVILIFITLLSSVQPTGYQRILQKNG